VVQQQGVFARVMTWVPARHEAPEAGGHTRATVSCGDEVVVDVPIIQVH